MTSEVYEFNYFTSLIKRSLERNLFFYFKYLETQGDSNFAELDVGRFLANVQHDQHLLFEMNKKILTKFEMFCGNLGNVSLMTKNLTRESIIRFNSCIESIVLPSSNINFLIQFATGRNPTRGPYTISYYFDVLFNTLLENYIAQRTINNFISGIYSVSSYVSETELSINYYESLNPFLLKNYIDKKIMVELLDFKHIFLFPYRPVMN